MSRNVILTDVNDEQILPITTSENVFVGEGITLKETLENLPGGGSVVVIDKDLSETSENPVQNKVITEKLNEVFTSVSNGKSLIASAITDKGVITDAEATFEEMAENIGKIAGGGGSLTDVFSWVAGDETGIRLNSPIMLADEITLSHINIMNEEVTLDRVERINDYQVVLYGDFYSHYDKTIIKTLPGFFKLDCETVNTIDVYRRSMEFSTAGELILQNSNESYTKVNDGLAIGGYAYNPSNNWFFPFIVAENQEDCNYRHAAGVNGSFDSFVYDKNGKTYYYGIERAVQGDRYKIGGRALKINDIEPWADAYAQGRDFAMAMLDFYFGYI